MNLMLHCGAHAATANQVRDARTPNPTPTWMPIPHTELIEQVTSGLRTIGLDIVQQQHALSHEGNRYFGLFAVADAGKDVAAGEYSLVVGLRNSHDKTFPAGLVVGSQVFICDNLAFSGEIKLARKHTSQIRRDLPMLTASAIGKIAEMRYVQDTRITAYKGHDIIDVEAHDVVIRAVDAGVIPTSHIPDVLQHWRKPTHEAFQPRTAWSLFNAFTEDLKGNINLLPGRTQKLHGLMDTVSGLDFRK